MSRYEDTIAAHHDEIIICDKADLPHTIKGYYANQYGPMILINKSVKIETEKVCVLMEELGHHYTSVGDITDQKDISNRKQEKLARGWAYKELVTLSKLIASYRHGCRNRYEIADYVGVTESFLMDALEFYKEKYGLFYQSGKYLIRFDPFYIGVQDEKFFK